MGVYATLLLTFLTVNDKWQNVFYYPENEYQVLENKVAENGDFLNNIQMPITLEEGGAILKVDTEIDKNGESTIITKRLYKNIERQLVGFGFSLLILIGFASIATLVVGFIVGVLIIDPVIDFFRYNVFNKLPKIK